MGEPKDKPGDPRDSAEQVDDEWADLGRSVVGRSAFDLGDLFNQTRTRPVLVDPPPPEEGANDDSGLTPEALDALSAVERASAAETTSSRSEREMRGRFDMGDFTGALEAAEWLLQDHPRHEEALRYAASCREVLMQMYAARIGALDRVPRVVVPPNEVASLGLDHHTGFIISCVDGISTFADIVDVSGMSALESYRILCDLLLANVIAVRCDPPTLEYRTGRMRIVVTGATGFIGTEVVGRLAPEHELVILSRRPEGVPLPPGARAARWDALAGPPDPADLAGSQAVVHLAGESVAARRWSAEQKKRILESRSLGTRHLVEGLGAAGVGNGAVLVSASAVGYYGDRGDEELDESSSPGKDFLAQVCVDWEAESQRATELGLRVVNPRIGFVLGRGGALEKLLTPFKLGIGGPLGSGQQWMPWVHVADVAGMIEHAISVSDITGPMNATAPEPVRNADFARALGKALGRPSFMPTPKFALRVALGEMGEMVVASDRALPRKALATGYHFLFSELATALADVLRS